MRLWLGNSKTGFFVTQDEESASLRTILSLHLRTSVFFFKFLCKIQIAHAMHI